MQRTIGGRTGLYLVWLTVSNKDAAKTSKLILRGKMRRIKKRLDSINNIDYLTRSDCYLFSV